MLYVYILCSVLASGCFICAYKIDNTNVTLILTAFVITLFVICVKATAWFIENTKAPTGILYDEEFYD